MVKLDRETAEKKFIIPTEPTEPTEPECLTDGGPAVAPLTMQPSPPAMPSVPATALMVSARTGMPMTMATPINGTTNLAQVHYIGGAHVAPSAQYNEAGSYVLGDEPAHQPTGAPTPLAPTALNIMNGAPKKSQAKSQAKKPKPKSPELSEYEKAKNKQVTANHEQLVSLGLEPGLYTGCKYGIDHPQLDYHVDLFKKDQRVCIWYNAQFGWQLGRISKVTQANTHVIYDDEPNEYKVTKAMIEKDYGKTWAFVSPHSFTP